MTASLTSFIEKDMLPFTSIFEKATLFESSLFAKDRLPMVMVKSRLALRSPGCLFVCHHHAKKAMLVTMPYISI